MTLLTLREVATDLALSVQSVRRLIHGGRLAAVNVGLGEVPVFCSESRNSSGTPTRK